MELLLIPLFFISSGKSAYIKVLWWSLFMNQAPILFLIYLTSFFSGCQPKKNRADFTGYPSNHFQGYRLNGRMSAQMYMLRIVQIEIVPRGTYDDFSCSCCHIVSNEFLGNQSKKIKNKNS